jgi:hypothetical protein
MKYIKLFEDIDGDTIDKDYIEMCFVDFIDQDNFKFNFQAGGAIEREKTCDITIDIADSSLPFSSSIREFTKRTELRNQLFNKIEECLSKVKIEYPTMKHKVMDMAGADQTEVKIYLSLSESYIAHNPSGWFSI